MKQLLENLFLTRRRESYGGVAPPIIPPEEWKLDTPLLYLAKTFAANGGFTKWTTKIERWSANGGWSN